MANKRPPFAIPDIINPAYRRCIKVFVPDDEQHLALFAGLLRQLTDWQRWERDALKRGTQVAQVWREVFYQIDWTGQDCNNCEEGCMEFTPEAPFIEWFPNNPFTEPDLVTDGYNSPAWYKSTLASEILLGTQPGDVVTDLSRFPPGSLPTIIPASGLPRFRINLTAPGLVRLHLLNLFGGSLAQITIDDNLSTIRFIDLDRDQIAVPFETSTTTIEEVEVLGAGAHHIDVIIVAQINDQIPFLHHGGGLRKVEICNGGVEVPYYELRQNPEDNCLIEQRQNPNSEWIEAFRMDNCCCDDQETITRVNNYYIEESTDGGETWTQITNDPRFTGMTLPPRTGGDPKCDAAQSTVDMVKDHFDQLIVDVNAGAAITAVIAALIALLAIVVSLGTLAPLLLPLASAIFWAGGAAIDAALTTAVYDSLLCKIFCHSEDDGSYTEAGWLALIDDILGDTTNFLGLSSDLLRGYIGVLGPVGLSNAASYNPTADGDCSECDCGENCAEKYVAGVIGGIPRATNITYGGDWIEFNLYDNYGYIRAQTSGDCCFVGSIDVISGTAQGTGFTACGVEYPNITQASPVGQTPQWIEIQGSNQARVRIHLGN